MQIKISETAIRNNAKRISALTPFYAVVKANAYGLGATKISALLESYAQGFCVANTEEAKELISSGIKKDILVLGKTRHALKAPSIIYTVSSKDDIDRLSRISTPKFAVKVNTGMNRYGADPKDVLALSKYASERGVLHSVYSHLSAPGDRAFTRKQLSIFNNCSSTITAPKHICASAGLDYPDLHLDFCRCGIALYGGTVNSDPVIKITAPILEVRKLKSGERCGYGILAFGKDVNIAVVGIGYADGYRRLSAPRYVYINNKLCRVVAVCMDVCFALIDENITTFDEAEIIGEHITLNDLAKSYGTITYEVLTGLGKR
ncbi:MAG: alanine racemase, partial [Clostridia bacterium]|nr:alanine racemase [Clostridia bacterium]